MNSEMPILPVALRNTEITEDDFRMLAQKAGEIVAANSTITAPKKVREGKRHRVRV